MSELEQTRRLAAILAADVAGYSRLMGQDESDTVHTLTEYREVFVEHISRHRGQVIDTAGDSVLATFDSPVEAVACAAEIQHELAQRNSNLTEDRQMHFRIGINLGDVIFREDNTVYGDGVNIAARLESLAKRGGITVSGTVFDHAENKLPLAFEFTGEQEVKNIAKPVRVYRVIAETTSGASPGADKPLALPNKPSIAVLPFDNLSGDSDQEFFADGIAEDLITALSNIRWMFVTARNSTFAYKGQSPDIRQVGQELGVRYVLEGSVRKGGKRIRVSAQLIDATTGSHVWAERYDRELAELFDLQDEITEAIAAAIEPAIGEAERDRAKRKPPENLDAWESYQRGLWHMYQFTAEDNVAAHNFFTRAIALDEQFAPPHGALAYTLYIDIILGFAQSRGSTISTAIARGREGISVDNKDPMSHFGLGRVLTMAGEHDAALAELEIAVDLNPNFALAHLGLGVALNAVERSREAIQSLDRAIRLSPHDPMLWTMENSRAVANIHLGNYEQAVDDARRACRHPNTGFVSYLSLASALAHLDRLDEARATMENVYRLKPEFSWKTAMETASHSKLADPGSNFGVGLRKAGLDVPPIVAADNNI